MRIPGGTFEMGKSSLRTHSVPHTDSFSYTRGGQPWYAWEWLYDLAIGAIHHVAGLNGIVLFTAVIIAGTFRFCFVLFCGEVAVLSQPFPWRCSPPPPPRSTCWRGHVF